MEGEREELLVYRVGEGWESLCASLRKSVPEVEFPRVNETERFGAALNRMLLGGVSGLW